MEKDNWPDDGDDVFSDSSFQNVSESISLSSASSREFQREIMQQIFATRKNFSKLTFTTQDANPMPEAGEFINLDLSSKEDNRDENVRIIINEAEASGNIYQQLSRLKTVSNLLLCVKARNSIQILNGLQRFIPETGTLLHLFFEIEFNTERSERTYSADVDVFLNIFNRYTSLRYVAINSSTLSTENFIEIRVAIMKNQAIRDLAHEIRDKLIEFRNKSTPSEEEQLIQLGKYYTRFWDLRKDGFISADDFYALMGGDVTDKEITFFKNAENYHLLLAVGGEDFDLVRGRILPDYIKEERNALYWYHGVSPVRVLDKVTIASTLIQLCNDHEFDLLTHSEYRKEVYCLDLKNSLFRHKLSAEEVVKINAHPVIILDALAFLISTAQEMKFAKLFNQYHELIDCNAAITGGIYRGYTILQLICVHFYKFYGGRFFDRSTLLSTGHEIKCAFYDYLEPHYLDVAARRAILNSRFPEDSENHPLTVLQYLVYHHNSALLFKIFPNGNSLVATDSISVYSDQPSKWGGLNLLNLFLFRFISPDYNSESMEQSIGLYEWITKPEHMALLGGDANLISIINHPTDFDHEYPQHTLFQLAILRDAVSFIQFCQTSRINFRGIINRTFPEENALYRGWTPLQVAIYLAKRSKIHENMICILVQCGADLSARYPLNSYLSGLPAFHAMLLDCCEDPYIDDSDVSENKAGYTSLITGRNYGRNFSSSLIQFVFDQLNPQEVNAICQLRRSRYYAMTALHTALLQRNRAYVSIILDSNKTNYTIRDNEGRDALDCAKHSGDEELTRLVLKAQQDFPEHIDHYYRNLKYDSEVCPSFQVTPDVWVVSFVREKGSDHAFLTIEGLEYNAEEGISYAFIRLAHLVARAPVGKGRIKLIARSRALLPGQKKDFSLLPEGADNITLILKPGSIFFPESDEVDKNLCNAIWNEILAEANINETRYAAWGPMKWFTSSSVSSSQKYDNCVSWALRNYNRLVKESSQISYSASMYFVTHARGILNRSFHFVRQIEEGDMLERQLFQISVHSDNIFKTQVRDVSRLNYLYTLCIALTVFCIGRESGIESSYASNRMLSMLLALMGGGASHVVNKYCFPFKETPSEEIMQPRAPTLTP